MEKNNEKRYPIDKMTGLDEFDARHLNKGFDKNIKENQELLEQEREKTKEEKEIIMIF